MLNVETAATVAERPRAFFFGEAALAEHGETAAAYEKAVAEYERCGDACILWEALAGLGFDPAEIQWHAEHRGERMRCGYIVPV